MGRQTNLRMLVYYLRCLCESVCVHSLLTRVSRCHFAATPSSRETPRVRPCISDGNGLDDNYKVEGQGEVSENMPPLTARQYVACTSREHHAL